MRTSRPLDILVVGGEPDLRYELTDVLRAAGHSVSCAPSVDAAVARLRSKAAHLVVTSLVAMNPADPLLSVRPLLHSPRTHSVAIMSNVWRHFPPLGVHAPSVLAELQSYGKGVSTLPEDFDHDELIECVDTL